jgi:hypothetical protein
LQARGVAAELLKTGIADGDGSTRTIKLELHRIVLYEGKSQLARMLDAICSTTSFWLWRVPLACLRQL